jgi:hypothetical protein
MRIAVVSASGIKANKELLPLQPGDVFDIYRNEGDLV